jgi:SAM-dependent methyltransferase
MAGDIHKYWFDHPEVWATINQERFRREPAALLSLFQRLGGVSSVLDVGCGTGGHLAALSDAGLRTVGVDKNEQMVAFARSNIRGPEFIVGDMRRFRLPDQFDALICLCTTFSYNLTNDEVAASLRSFRRALRLGGFLIIDVFNAIALIQGRSFVETREETWAQFPKLRLEHRHRIDCRRQLLLDEMRWFDGNELVHTDSCEFRLFFPQELAYLMASSGFDVLDLMGGMDGKDVELHGPRLVVVARVVGKAVARVDRTA